MVFFNLWPNWGATLYGEVRGATDFKRNFKGMFYALVATTVLAVVLFLLISKTITWQFYYDANGAFWNNRWGYTEAAPPLPIWPYPALLAVLMTSSRVLQFIVILLMGLWSSAGRAPSSSARPASSSPPPSTACCPKRWPTWSRAPARPSTPCC